MAFRFRRTISILPGVRLNFGKDGVSLSAGRRGLSFTINKSGIHSNVGAPGTGMSYRKTVLKFGNDGAGEQGVHEGQADTLTNLPNNSVKNGSANRNKQSLEKLLKK